MDDELWKSATGVLGTNWSGDHMVPSRRLYPHQWSWDAAFIAIGLARVDPVRAWRDLRTLFEAQWPDGRVPHIVFDPATAEQDYFPGPGFWDVPAYGDRPARGSTGIVQPPVHAIAAWEVYRQDPDRAELEWFYPRLVAQQDYLSGARDLGGGGLASIVHPWESGLDNSPAWDPALAAVPADGSLLTTYRRRDLAVSDAAHRPTDADYARYIGLVLRYRAEGYKDTGQHPFAVECPAFNAIAGAAESALAQIAAELGRPAEAAAHRDRAHRITEALAERLWNPRTRTFHARDARTGVLSPARCVSGLLPLLLPGLASDRIEAIMAEIRSPRFGLPAPSYDRTAPDFDTVRYWRGPVWINANWLLRRGLLTHGFREEAEHLRAELLRLVRHNGHFEYFHPDTGEGLGAPAFSWTAALSLELLATRR